MSLRLRMGLWAVAKNGFSIWVSHHELYKGTNRLSDR